MAGFSFPLLQRAVQTDLAQLGRRVGYLVAANILGSTLGAFVTGWVLLDFLGTAGTLKSLFMLSAGFGALALREITTLKRWSVRAAAYAGALVVTSVVLAMPVRQLLWATLHDTTPRRVLVAEDGSGLSLLKAESPGFRRVVVFVNGLGQSWIPYGNIHTVLGALPAFAHPNPRTAAVIGLGSGDTVFAMAGRQKLERVTSIEIIAPELATLREFSRIRVHHAHSALTKLGGDAISPDVFGHAVPIVISGRLDAPAPMKGPFAPLALGVRQKKRLCRSQARPRKAAELRLALLIDSALRRLALVLKDGEDPVALR